MNPVSHNHPFSSRLIQLHDWPHAPTHRTQQAGAYMITAATYQKTPIFGSSDRLTLLSNSLFDLAETYVLRLQAWAIFDNHYHFMAECPKPQNLKRFTRHLHSSTAIAINRQDNTPGRKVWFQYWESHLTFQRSYFARLSYVHQNPVRHGLVRTASQYPWCSAGWFERKANPAFFKTIMSFPIDKLEIPDDFEVAPPR
jgi:putative transposase